MLDQSEQHQEEKQDTVASEEWEDTNEYQEEDKNEGTEKALRHALAQCRKEKTEYLLGWQRCKADAINIKQQEEIKRRDIIQFAAENLIQSLIPVLETFNHALHGKDVKDPYVQGFGHIQTQLLVILGQQGLTVISETGAPFDVSRHESVQTVSVSKPEDDNKILETIAEGYQLHGKVIKPAKVKIGEYKKYI